jgi:hypothetical protein
MRLPCPVQRPLSTLNGHKRPIAVISGACERYPMRIACLLFFALCAACSATSPNGGSQIPTPQRSLSECLSWANAGAKRHSATWQGNLSECLYWASVEAKGTRLCNSKKREEYGSQFDRRYGDRVRAIIVAHGSDPDFIVTTSCRLWQGTESELDHRHAIALDEFERWLVVAERQVGIR